MIIDESGLTGESLPVEKTTDPLAEDTPLADRINMVYASSLMTAGQGSGLVVAIAQTQTGRVAQLMQSSTTLMTPLARRIHKPCSILSWGWRRWHLLKNQSLLTRKQLKPMTWDKG